MEKARRQKKWIIIYFLFYFVLLLWFVGISYNYIYPKIIEIEKIKNETKETSTFIKDIEKKWLSFKDFIWLNKKNNEKTYINELLKNLDEDFYNKNLVNTWELDYSNFINQKIQEFNNPENKKTFLERDLLVSSILPYYSDNYSWEDDEQSLSNFKFISYIETLLETFNLSSTSSIWIKDIEILNDYSPEKSLETNIYSIPVKLSLEWNKAWIINFLHYIENVWKISFINDNIVINNDDFLNKNNIKMKLEGDTKKWNYNIYEHQIIDINNIKIPWYLDESNEYRKGSFTDFIKETQWNDVINVDIDLSFYVKWYPQYKLEELINNILNQYTSLVKKINEKLKDINKISSNSVSYKKINDYLKEISADIGLIRKWINSKEKLEDVYKRAVQYKYIFDNISKLLEDEV